jgi:hypothetical protein
MGDAERIGLVGLVALRRHRRVRMLRLKQTAGRPSFRSSG